MSTKFKKDDVIKGKVTGIQPYGAFVALDDETQGLVHISEIKHGFVKDIHDVLSVGDEVDVQVLQVNEEQGKISLSMRALEEKPASVEKAAKRRQGSVKLDEVDSEGFNTLKDKLTEWIEKSEREDLIKK